MDEVTLWLVSLLDRHVKPDPRVADCHQGILDKRMKEMAEKLPEINKVFEGVQLEMAGSVLNRTKVGESDEFDVNLVIKLPFDEKHVTLAFDKSSPGYALLQVPKADVEAVQEDQDIFVERDNMFYVSAAKLDRILIMGISQDLNFLNSGGHGHGDYKENITFHGNMFGDIMVFKAEDGWEYSTLPKNTS